MATPVYLHHPSSLEHDPGPHPEQPARIPAIERELAGRDWLGFERREAPAADLELLYPVHPRSHIVFIEELSLRGGGPIDADTYTSSGSYEAALHAAGGAAHMVDLLLGGDAPVGFCGLRPPGHHAEPMRAMGFCLFNNVAVAARRALDAHGAERVMIVDWDVHHGNGTNDIFHDSSEVLFVSLHESPLYPGTGPASDTGAGAGEGHTVNLPVPGGSVTSSGARWWSTWWRCSVAPSRRACCSSPPGSTPRGRSAGHLPGHRRGLRRDGGLAAAVERRAPGAARARARGGIRPRRAGAVGGDASSRSWGPRRQRPRPSCRCTRTRSRPHRASSAGGRRYLGLPRPDQAHVGARRLALEGGGRPASVRQRAR